MSPQEQQPTPDVDALARSMLLIHGAHDDEPTVPSDGTPTSWSNAALDPRRVAALREATEQDRERYLTSGLQPVDCRFCHVSVQVKKLGPGHTSVQWTKEASQRCAHFAEVREGGGNAARVRACPKLADSIDHAIAEGILDAVCSAPPPGDG